MLVREVVRMLRHAFGRDIDLQASIQPGVLVHGNSSDLQQVLLNLCLNARDAMPEGGVLRIGTRSLPVAPPDIAWRPDHPLAILTVADTGVGMDDLTRERIFEPFFTTKGEGRAYGLGLASVREIIGYHGGLVAVESTQGQGSTFTIYLPLVEPDAERLSSTLEHEAVTPHRPLPSSVSILLVDDEQIVRRSVARRLRQAGFEVTEAADGQEALQSYRHRPCTLVLLDLDMPGLDGETTHARLAELDPAVRVVYATGYADVNRAAQIRAQGALALLEKPYDIEELVELAAQVVEGVDPDASEPDTRPW
jgi:CheY-like chemotaxis protein